jgi:deoxycytidine triphosphate deaminase
MKMLNNNEKYLKYYIKKKNSFKMIFHNQKFKIHLQIKSIICKIIFFEMQKIYQKYEIHIGKKIFQLLRNTKNKRKDNL